MVFIFLFISKTLLLTGFGKGSVAVQSMVLAKPALYLMDTWDKPKRFGKHSICTRWIHSNLFKQFQVDFNWRGTKPKSTFFPL